MAETTGIAWCDSTFNAWIGCTKVSPGCDHCYAEALDARHRWGGNTHWGTAVPRYRTSANLWKQPLAWNRKAEASGKPWRVFTNSLADVFDNEVPAGWRADLFSLIDDTPALMWLLLTKRIGNAPKMLTMKYDRRIGEAVPFPNVWIGASVVNQEEADRDIPKLLATPAAKRFVSYDPDTESLRIRFKNGALYEYRKVPQDVADDFGKCDSFGRFHATKIKGNFEYERIKEDEKDGQTTPQAGAEGE